MNLTEQSPVEIDQALFPILERIGGKEHHRQSYQDRLNGVPRYPGAHVWPLSDRERKDYEEAVARYTQEIADLDDEARPFEREYDNRPWTRYIVVPGGHLHKRGCHTLTPGRTMVGQVAEASGLDEAEVIAKFDEQACTHCFPNAPVAEKKTPAEEGFCEHSGTYAPAEKIERYGMRDIATCECGSVQTLTSLGKFRKHKAAA